MSSFCDLSCRFNALDEMKKILPEYIVQCFIMSGYDTHHAVLEMDTSENPGNSIEEIEQYIDKNKFPSCMSSLHHENQNRPFQFPPGHKVLIKMFVEDVKERFPKSRKHKISCTRKPPRKAKKPKKSAADSDKQADANSSDEEEEDDILLVTNEIRTKIGQWAKNTLKKSIKENEHFTIITQREINSRKLSVHVRCSCGKVFTLQQKKSGSKPWLISNWSKHYKTNMCGKREQQGGKQENLQSWFSSHDSVKAISEGEAVKLLTKTLAPNPPDKPTSLHMGPPSFPPYMSMSPDTSDYMSPYPPMTPHSYGQLNPAFNNSTFHLCYTPFSESSSHHDTNILLDQFDLEPDCNRIENPAQYLQSSNSFSDIHPQTTMGINTNVSPQRFTSSLGTRASPSDIHPESTMMGMKTGTNMSSQPDDGNNLITTH